jgi:AcrR family transcriptional regulator
LAAWEVAEDGGWTRFSVERVAARAELGRATVYSYFESAAALICAMARQALDALAERLKVAPGLAEALDVPVRFAQANAAAFYLLFPGGAEPAQPFSSEELNQIRAEAHRLISHLQRLALRDNTQLASVSADAGTFLTGISLAAAIVPELRASTTLRRRWQNFCLGENPDPVPDAKQENGTESKSRR